MYCPNIDSFSITGLQSSPYVRYLSLKVDSCRKLAADPETECESETEINK